MPRILEKTTLLAGGALLGAASMYLLDPQTGRRRRAVARDKAGHLLRVGANLLAKSSRDFNHRLVGALSSLRALSSPEEREITDDLLVERIRSKAGRAVQHPHGLGITAHNGVITLEGPVEAAEVEPLLWRVFEVKGVVGVENRLTVKPAAPGQQLRLLPPGRITRLKMTAPHRIGEGIASSLAALALYNVLRGNPIFSMVSLVSLGAFASGITPKA